MLPTRVRIARLERAIETLLLETPDVFNQTRIAVLKRSLERLRAERDRAGKPGRPTKRRSYIKGWAMVNDKFRRERR